SGAPITGSDRRFLNKAGMDMGIPLLFFFARRLCAGLGRPDDARSRGRMAIAPRSENYGWECLPDKPPYWQSARVT
ncbi:MAG: hypothetical protein ABWY14_22375, partial [Tardiphaga sp.]